MWSSFEKNIYTPQEIAKAMIHVDNTRCQLAVTRVKFFVEQRLTIRGRGGILFGGAHVYNTTRKLVERDVAGPGAGVGNWQTELLLDLSQIRYEVVGEYKKKKGVQKRLSPEDRFMMAGVQPACHSGFITNEYFICIELAYDGCTCCANLPDSRMMMTIVPIVNPACFGFMPPDGYMPINLGGSNF